MQGDAPTIILILKRERVSLIRARFKSTVTWTSTTVEKVVNETELTPPPARCNIYQFIKFQLAPVCRGASLVIK
jgi:hypothetical protein